MRWRLTGNVVGVITGAVVRDVVVCSGSGNKRLGRTNAVLDVGERKGHFTLLIYQRNQTNSRRYSYQNSGRYRYPHNHQSTNQSKSQYRYRNKNQNTSQRTRQNSSTNSWNHRCLNRYRYSPHYSQTNRSNYRNRNSASRTDLLLGPYRHCWCFANPSKLVRQPRYAVRLFLLQRGEQRRHSMMQPCLTSLTAALGAAVRTTSTSTSTGTAARATGPAGTTTSTSTGSRTTTPAVTRATVRTSA